NGYGKGLPYNSILWIAFSPPGERRAGAQFFVRVAPEGIRYGLRLGRAARQTRALLRAGVESQADALFRRLRDNGALAGCRFGLADLPETHRVVEDVEGLRAWAAGRTLEASCSRPAGDPLLGR